MVNGKDFLLRSFFVTTHRDAHPTHYAYSYSQMHLCQKNDVNHTYFTHNDVCSCLDIIHIWHNTYKCCKLTDKCCLFRGAPLCTNICPLRSRNSHSAYTCTHTHGVRIQLRLENVTMRAHIHTNSHSHTQASLTHLPLANLRHGWRRLVSYVNVRICLLPAYLYVCAFFDVQVHIIRTWIHSVHHQICFNVQLYLVLIYAQPTASHLHCHLSKFFPETKLVGLFWKVLVKRDLWAWASGFVGFENCHWKWTGYNCVWQRGREKDVPVFLNRNVSSQMHVYLLCNFGPFCTLYCCIYIYVCICTKVEKYMYEKYMYLYKA